MNEAQVGYRMDVRERPLRWIGRGLSEFGITAGAELDEDQFDAARALIYGQDPRTGEQLVSGKVAVPDDAKLGLAPLVAAVRAHAQQYGLAPAELFASSKLAARWATAERQVQRLGEAARLRADEALEFVDAALPAGEDADRLSALPWDRDEVVQAYANLTHARPVRDESSGDFRVEQSPRRVEVGIKAFDINIGLPKSYSLLLALAPEEVAARVEEVYSAAAERMFAWTEDRTSYVMRGQHGRGKTAECLDSSGFAGWVMVHRAARPVGEAPIGDPHWHAHITVANMARGADGHWSTVAAGGRDLMRHAAAIDKLTQAEVRRELGSQLGIEFARSERTGLWEVAHIPDAAIQQFSKRGGQVEAVLGELGYTRQDVSQAQQRVLTRASRSAKSETTAAGDDTLRAYWQREARATGDPQTWMPRVLAGSGHAATAPTVAALAQTLSDPESGLTAHTRRFSRLDAVCRVADELPSGARAAEVEAMTDLVLQHPAFVAVAGGEATAVSAGTGGRRQLGARHMSDAGLYTTHDVPEVEQQILAAAAASSSEQGHAVVGAKTVDLAVAVVEAEQGFELSGEQRQVLAEVAGHGHQLRTVEGPPGTGKTTLMRAARVAWTAQGYTVAGAATAAVAAQNLRAESGIEAATVAGWLRRIESGPGLSGLDVLVVDEANLTSDRDRARLYAEAGRTGTKLVEVGDPQQLRGVGIGSLFGWVHRSLDGPRLSDNRRQLDEDERAALAAYRAGRHHEALQDWADRGRIHGCETAQQALSEMVATWLEQRAGAPEVHTQLSGLVMLAGTNEQVARINHTVQAVRAERGELGPAQSFATPHGGQATFHAGDHVLIRRNDRNGIAITGEAVLNGYRGVVTDITAAGVGVAWRGSDEALHTARLSPSFIADGGLELGYALTAHKAEGLTVGGSWTRPDGTEHRGSVLVYAPGMDNPALYVSASRHKGQTLLFGSREELEGERETLMHGSPRSHGELTARVAARLADRAEATAADANDRPVLADLDHPLAATASTPGPVAQQDVETSSAGGTPDLAAVESSTGAEEKSSAPGMDVSPEAMFARMDRWRVEQSQADDPQQEQGPSESRAEPAGQRLQQIQTALRSQDWRHRRYGSLTNRDLLARIEGERERRDAAQNQQQARREAVAEREPQIAAGNGPRVREVEQRLQRLRDQARPAQEVAEVQQQYKDKEEQARRATWQANRIQHSADRLPWYRMPTRRAETRRAEQLREQARQAHSEAEPLRVQFERRQQDVGGSQAWRQALGERDRAESRYPHDRDTAQHADQRDLDQLKHGITAAGTTAERAEHRLAELTDEHATRQAMPTEQAQAERESRSRWRQSQQARKQAETDQQRHGPSAHELDHLHRQQHLGRGMDGPSLGR